MIRQPFQFAFVLAGACALACIGPAQARPGAEEAEEEWGELPLTVSKATIEKVMKVPDVQAATGFKSRVLVPTGSPIYDPFDTHVVSETEFWTADDGATGAVYSVTLDGKVKLIADTKKHSPYSIDVAPKGFGQHAGKIYAISFNKPEKAGGWELPMAITRIDPATGRDEVVCFLPPNDKGAPGAGGFFLRFGPDGSPFANKLWITTASNHSLYTVTADDQCKWTKTFDLEKSGSPRGIAFLPNGSKMMVGFAVPAPDNRAITTPGKGHIQTMSVDGMMDEKSFTTGLHEPGAFTFAPKGFGAYAGQLFVSDAGNWDNAIEATEPVNHDGYLYRVDADGKLQVVLSKLANPVGVAFLGKTLVVTDINGDFHVGTQKFQDGFAIAVDLAN